MERDFFKYLLSEITTDILSRLPFRSLVISKSVCKPWLNLIDSDDFRKSEIKTPPALVLLTEKTMDSTWCAIFEIEDEDGVDAEKSHDFHHILLMDLEIPHGNRATMKGTWRRVEAGALNLMATFTGEHLIWVVTCRFVVLMLKRNVLDSSQFLPWKMVDI
ncbi:uncharacterized protein LOC121742978 [Salvia splendens]|uniref:uncharacterized protein LOC121742978 n=1 Tax=Salvia splendens TaxID=180675 RepID=UPI001C256E14|nr:uncharacterized protein LOC121742978 [Salvia splendens]